MKTEVKVNKTYELNLLFETDREASIFQAMLRQPTIKDNLRKSFPEFNILEINNIIDKIRSRLEEWSK